MKNIRWRISKTTAQMSPKKSCPRKAAEVADFNPVKTRAKFQAMKLEFYNEKYYASFAVGNPFRSISSTVKPKLTDETLRMALLTSALEKVKSYWKSSPSVCFFKSPVCLFTILQIQHVATFIYLRGSQTDLQHIACELWGKVLSVITGKILPTHMCISPIEFIEVSHAYIRVGSGP